jgi:DNA mismatch repair ATPase MutS
VLYRDLLQGIDCIYMKSDALNLNILDPDVLNLDGLTLKDLEIFESDSGGQTLFDLCNQSRSEGGARILRQRMSAPWSNPDRIRETQNSLHFIQEHRSVFDKLPSAYATGRVGHYLQDILPIVTHHNSLEFAINAFSLWANHDTHYRSIVRGVQITCRVIQGIREFMSQAELQSAGGELVQVFQEIQTLLEPPGLSKVSTEEHAGWAFKILRLDQDFRIHEKETVSRLLALIFEIDALVAMADVTRNNGYVMPSVEEGPMRVVAEGLVHPFLQQAVANPVNISQEQRVLFLTGPNMAGKTTYLRAFATSLYLAHLGMGVPASRFSFVPAEQLFSSISLSDDLSSGISYFRAEALRVKAIAQAISKGNRVVAIMDEPFKGTNVKDAFDASKAILERFSTKEACLFMFSSHLIELSEHISNDGKIDCRYFQAQEGEGRLRFDYLLRPGVSSQRLGMRVLREEGVFELLDGRSE